MFKWEEGRQGGGYYKMKLMEISWPIKADMYILKFPEGSEVKPHIDPSPSYGRASKHYRLNIIAKKAKTGGEFMVFKGVIFKDTDEYKDVGRVSLMRPDVNAHKMKKVEKGCSYWLSIGWLKEEDFY
jgi:hypothetical protein